MVKTIHRKTIASLTTTAPHAYSGWVSDVPWLKILWGYLLLSTLVIPSEAKRSTSNTAAGQMRDQQEGFDCSRLTLNPIRPGITDTIKHTMDFEIQVEALRIRLEKKPFDVIGLRHAQRTCGVDTLAAALSEHLDPEIVFALEGHTDADAKRLKKTQSHLGSRPLIGLEGDLQILGVTAQISNTLHIKRLYPDYDIPTSHILSSLAITSRHPESGYKAINALTALGAKTPLLRLVKAYLLHSQKQDFQAADKVSTQIIKAIKKSAADQKLFLALMFQTSETFVQDNNHQHTPEWKALLDYKKGQLDYETYRGKITQGCRNRQWAQKINDALAQGKRVVVLCGKDHIKPLSRLIHTS